MRGGGGGWRMGEAGGGWVALRVELSGSTLRLVGGSMFGPVGGLERNDEGCMPGAVCLYLGGIWVDTL